MMKKLRICGTVALIAVLSGCASQLGVKQVVVDPSTATGGDQFMIAVHFDGAKGKIASVTATVRENPDVFFALNDEGKNGDAKAGDNIWSLETTVPYDAPAATYNMDISAIDVEGNEVVTKGLEGHQLGRSGHVAVTIE